MPSAQTKLYTEADYYNLPEDVRAELIEGNLIYNQAAPSRIHQTILSELHTVINNYVKSKGGSCRVYPAPFAVKLRADRRTIVEPDISVICDRNKLTDRGCTGAPDWIIEIVSPSNLSHDYILQLNLYANAGVREYWIVDPVKESIFVYYLEQEHFKAEAHTFQDKIRTTGLAGGLLTPCKGSLPALESKDSSKGSPAATSFCTKLYELILSVLFYWLTRKRVNILLE